MKKYLFVVAICVCINIVQAQIIVNNNLSGLKKGMACNGELNAVAAVSLGEERRITSIFNHNGGTFDLPALLSTSIDVKNNSCVVLYPWRRWRSDIE
jgi:hypothetical protein